MRPVVVVPTFNAKERLERLLESLAPDAEEFEVVVVDNASTDGTAELVRRRFPAVQLLELEENLGFGRAVNRGVQSSSGDPIVLVNNDCVCAPGFVSQLAQGIDARRGVVMAAGVMRNRDRRDLIDTAGVSVDQTLLVYDHLQGQPLSALDGAVSDPLGPCGAAAAYDRAAFLDVGGFDDAFFAYWEDVDLALRLTAAGGRCALRSTARGVHEHAATLGSGSRRKNYLMGYGRGYLLRKWSVLSPKRLPQVLLRELAICAGQVAIDRTVAGMSGRIAGYRAARAVPRYPYPERVVGESVRATALLGSRLRRRLRMRAHA